ncbi:hypothetical protein C5167_010139 [Papaver somniferum]|uniref:Uncharacterized protein n=1 Tax=Papaver somniferum TaxID=3469 RepID=A0A4Y7K3D3_PAPSO|nr:hypothetical protein C5167_010138 [Papaver somniferum]RZC66449.1 hypothetical protein C5167_010139 [Papaver somniferum]
MAATKTSLMFFLFALIAISANMQMVSAGLPLNCATALVEVKLPAGESCPTDLKCDSYCTAPVGLRLDASVCVPGVASVTANVCFCCYISLL